MRVPEDLHPDDTTHRHHLAAQLHAARDAAGISAGRLAVALGYRDHSGVRQMERRHAWQAATLQRWARALGQQVTFTLHDLTVPNDADTLAHIYTATLATQDLDPVYVDLVVVRQAVNDLARIRRHLMGAPEFGRRVDLDATSVLWREANPDGVRISVLQQTARALGGALTVGLTPAPARAETVAA
ncbi:hypothetical protein [Micromonospora sp. NPDC050695]|uniref:hypothetical protein n=1 Tax=Micromonospora sp. NPDC050695 TaxID=3154938 RepID=UPI003403089A